jgi:hypothetical protein
MLSFNILNVVAPIKLQNKLELYFGTFNEIWSIWCTTILSTCHLINQFFPMDDSCGGRIRTLHLEMMRVVFYHFANVYREIG